MNLKTRWMGCFGLDACGLW